MNAPTGAPRSRGVFTAFTFLVALAALALSAWQFARRGELDTRDAIAALQARATSLARENENLEAAVAAANARLDAMAAATETLRSGVDALESRTERDTIDFALAEVEHLLIIATQRMALDRDARTALAALEAADRRLAGIGDAGAATVRAQLATDMNALRAVPDVDVPGLSLFLADLVQRVESLPLLDEYLRRREAGAGRAAVPEGTRGWRAFWQGIWSEISRHMIITRREQGGRVMLLPEEKFFLAHNLRLQLETARLAVLRGDTAALRGSLEVAIKWIETYYDTGESAVANVLETLRRMSSVRLDPELPDISSSLESVRALVHERAAGRAEAAP